MKKLSILLGLLAGITAFGQNAPTLYSYTVDTLCDGEWNVKFISITIEDLDEDSTYIDVVTANNTVIDGQQPFTIINPPYVPGETLRTIEVHGSASWGLPSGLNFGDVNFEVIGNPALDPNSGAIDFDITDVPVYGEIIPIWNTSPIDLCSNGNPIDLYPYVDDPSGVFSWQTSISGGNSNSNVFDPELAYPVYVYNGTEYYIQYTITNSAGCSGFTDGTLNYFIAPDVVTSPTPSTCQNADGSALANITNGTAPYDVYWTTGFSEQVSMTTSVSNLSSGSYYVNVEDANGCKAVGLAQVNDADLNITPTITPSYCAGQNGSVDLAVTASGNVTDVFWSNGHNTTTLTTLPGEYLVEIHTDNNCNYFGSFIIPDSALGVNMNGYSGSNSCLTPDGMIDIETVGGQMPYTWSWTHNGSGFSTMEDISNGASGVYECTVMDNNGCSLTWDMNMPNWGTNVIAYVNELTKADCGQTNGAIDVFVDTVWGEVPASYQWSTGATTEDLTGLTAGSYTLTYTDLAGCETQIAVEVPYNLPYQPEICVMTVDTSFTYNQVVWEKDITQSIDGFNVYRETSVFGEFEKVAERPYGLTSEFMDNSASPMDRSWRYYVTTYDACGNESFPSFIHKTIHTIAVDVGGGNFNVSWDEYEGISYSSVDLFRYDDTNGWQNIGTFPFGTLSTPDSPPVLSGLDYIVSFNLSDVCTSFKAQSYNSSRSNNSSGAWAGGGSTTSIQDEEIGDITIYPNPTNDVLNIYVERPELFEQIELRDGNGRVIMTSNMSQSNSMFDLNDIANGVYFVRLISDSKIINHKVIKR